MRQLKESILVGGTSDTFRPDSRHAVRRFGSRDQACGSSGM